MNANNTLISTSFREKGRLALLLLPYRPQRVCSGVAPSHPAFLAKAGAILFLKQALRNFWLAVILAALTGGGAVSARAEVMRTQTIQLQRGWNAVFLEVFPQVTAPEAVFSNAPISIVAAHFPRLNAVEFVKDPSKINWKKDGWGVWYAPQREDAFLSTLHSVDGNKAYLIYAEADFAWTVEGHVLYERRVWKANSFNFAGFGVDEVSPPTFGKFFGGSRAHAQRRIYRLANGRWEKVATPDATLMKTGEACWVYCDGASDFQGPLSVTIPFGTGVTFGGTGSGRASIALANSSTDPMSIKVESNNGGVPLAYVLKSLSQDQIGELFVDLAPAYSLPVMEAGAQASLILQVRREKMSQGYQTSLVKISSDNGARIWLPVAAQREDLGTTP
jgi:hypothetical protein